MRLPLLLLAAAALGASPVVQEDAVRSPFEGRITVVAVADPEDGYRINILSEKGSIKELCRRIGEEVGRKVIGLDLITREPMVDIYMKDRPWRDALRWALGSAGLEARVNAGSIEVREELPAYPGSDDAYQLALLRWQRVRATFPDHPEADQHEFALGDCAQAMGRNFTTTAIVHYENIPEAYPESSLVPEALERAGSLYAEIEEWSSAVLRYHELADLPISHPYHALARRELARALCHIGEAEGNLTLRAENAEKALLTLEALDLGYPTTDSSERRERALLQALAQTLTDDPIRAMRTLDLAANYSPLGYQDLDLMEIRALALERAGRPSDAARAWLAHAGQLTGEPRKQSLIRAAQASLDGGNEIATMTIVELAKRDGFGRDLASFAITAQSRLGLVGDLSALSIDQRIVRGRALLAEQSYREAARVLSQVYDLREDLKPTILESVAIDLARALAQDGRSTEAIDVLRTCALELQDPYDRSAIYRTAADLLEDLGRWEAAIEALKGRL